jgi:hypothetical protein
MLMGNNVGVSAVNTYSLRRNLLKQIDDVLNTNQRLVNGNIINAMSNYVYASFIIRMKLNELPNDMLRKNMNLLLEKYRLEAKIKNNEYIQFPRYDLIYFVKALISSIEEVDNALSESDDREYLNVLNLYKISMLSILNDISSILI